MPVTKDTQATATPPVKSKSINLRLSSTLQQRAERYADVSGLKITALLRNGLDELLKKLNF